MKCVIDVFLYKEGVNKYIVPKEMCAVFYHNFCHIYGRNNNKIFYWRVVVQRRYRVPSVDTIIFI